LPDRALALVRGSSAGESHEVEAEVVTREGSSMSQEQRAVPVRYVCALCLAGLCGTATGQTKEAAAAWFRVEMVSTHMQSCSQMDELLRSVCAKVSHHMSEANRKFCELPGQPFATRTARAYDEFKRINRDVFDANREKLEKRLAKDRMWFERDPDFAAMRAGRLSMLAAERVHRALNDKCATIEKEWLTPRVLLGK